MGFICSSLFPVYKVPNFDFPVTGTRGEASEGGGVFAEGVDPVDVPVAELAEEGLGEHPCEFGSIESTGIFAGFGEGVLRGIEVPGEGRGGAGGEVGCGRAGEGFDSLYGEG